MSQCRLVLLLALATLTLASSIHRSASAPTSSLLVQTLWLDQPLPILAVICYALPTQRSIVEDQIV